MVSGQRKKNTFLPQSRKLTSFLPPAERARARRGRGLQCDRKKRSFRHWVSAPSLRGRKKGEFGGRRRLHHSLPSPENGFQPFLWPIQKCFRFKLKRFQSHKGKEKPPPRRWIVSVLAETGLPRTWQWAQSGAVKPKKRTTKTVLG